MSSELRAGLAGLGIVDADVHPYPCSDDELLEYFEEPWRSFEFRVHERPISLRAAVVGPAAGGMRVEARAPDGGPAGSDPDLVARQLDEMARRLYVLLNPQDVRGRENPDREAAHCRAANAWMADTLLGRYNASGIYRGPLRVCVTDPALAVARD